MLCIQQDGKICEFCRHAVYGETVKVGEKICSGSEADAEAAARRLMDCAIAQAGKAGNPLKTLTPDPAFAAKSAHCVQAGLMMQ